jgi:hypothetical protein
MVDEIQVQIIDTLAKELNHKVALLLQQSLKGRIFQLAMLAAWVEQYLQKANEVTMKKKEMDLKKANVRSYYEDIIHNNDDELSKKHAKDKMKKAYEKYQR